MATIREASPRPWREGLRPASFGGALFHIETGGKASGRRIALHEYPKRDTPYAEDMGRRTITFTITGYIVEYDGRIGQDYRKGRDALIAALEKEGPQTIKHPTLDELEVICERYSVTESREKGGYCTFEMHFVESGQEANKTTFTNTQSAVNTSANNAAAQSGRSFKMKTKP